ncbi:MAG TPA: cytochrome c [Verrucomicrobiae bacterium]|nr:cytochrome c [Verrucomicrobiae bacterium]
MNLFVVLPVLAVLVLLAFRRVPLMAWAVAWWAGIFVVLRWGFAIPIPFSVLSIYMSIVTLALLAYMTSSDERRAQVAGPIVRLIVEPRYRMLLAALVVLIPGAAAANVWMQAKAPLEAPFFARTVHPASPASVTVHDKTIDLDAGENPFRSLETSNPEEFRKHVADGKRVYYENCVFCHGDNLKGNGMFIHALAPIPTNFDDSGTIPMLRETFLFWRISKGGPGMPEEGGPWDSAMPVWEKFLKEEDIWDVILFLYDFTGRKPRAAESVKDAVEKGH